MDIADKSIIKHVYINILLKCLGMPFGRLICASNKNNVLNQFIKTGRYDLSSRKLHLTVSPAIDILKSSNLERYLWHISDRRGDIIRELYASLESEDFFEVNEQVFRLLVLQVIVCPVYV